MQRAQSDFAQGAKEKSWQTQRTNARMPAANARSTRHRRTAVRRVSSRRSRREAGSKASRAVRQARRSATAGIRPAVSTPADRASQDDGVASAAGFDELPRRLAAVVQPVVVLVQRRELARNCEGKTFAPAAAIGHQLVEQAAAARRVFPQ